MVEPPTTDFQILLVLFESPQDSVALLHRKNAAATVAQLAVDPKYPVFFAATVVLQIIDLRQHRGFSVATMLEVDSPRMFIGPFQGVQYGHGFLARNFRVPLLRSIAIVDGK